MPAVIAVLPPAVSLVGDHEGCEPIGDGTGWRCVLDPYMELHDGSLPLSSSVRTLEFETTGETAGATIEFQAVSFGNDVLNDPHPENNIARMPLDDAETYGCGSAFQLSTQALMSAASCSAESWTPR